MSYQYTCSFVEAGAKHLSAVEIRPDRSHQHEFNGDASLRRLFGAERLDDIEVTAVYYDREGNREQDSCRLTWYDSRENQPHRSSEFRLYYTGNRIPSRARENDLLVIGRRADGSIALILSQNGSPSYNFMMEFFGHEIGTTHFTTCTQITI